MILGTANFGLEYGISNDGLKKDPSQVKSIFDCASSHGVLHLDTAPVYGNSETLIGTLWNDKRPLNVMSKLARIDCRDKRSIIDSVSKSNINTRQEKLWSLLLHNSEVIWDPKYSHVKETLLELLETGTVSNIGVSVYSEDELLRAKNFFPELNHFQIPENLCDRRKFHSRELRALSEQGNEIYVRSIFLQGLLLMNPRDLPDNLQTAGGTLEKFQVHCLRRNISVVEACVSYANSIPWSSGLVVGVDSREQLLEVIDSSKSITILDYDSFPEFDDWVLDPRNWS